MPVYTGFSTSLLRKSRLRAMRFIGEVMVLLGSFQGRQAGGILYQRSRRWEPESLQFANRSRLHPVGDQLLRRDPDGRVYALDRPARLLRPGEKRIQGFPEVNSREIAVLTPLAIMAILLGILPTLFFLRLHQSHGVKR